MLHEVNLGKPLGNGGRNIQERPSFYLLLELGGELGSHVAGSRRSEGGRLGCYFFYRFIIKGAGIGGQHRHRMQSFPFIQSFPVCTRLVPHRFKPFNPATIEHIEPPS